MKRKKKKYFCLCSGVFGEWIWGCYEESSGVSPLLLFGTSDIYCPISRIRTLKKALFVPLENGNERC